MPLFCWRFLLYIYLWNFGLLLIHFYLFIFLLPQAQVQFTEGCLNLFLCCYVIHRIDNGMLSKAVESIWDFLFNFSWKCSFHRLEISCHCNIDLFAIFWSEIGGSGFGDTERQLPLSCKYSYLSFFVSAATSLLSFIFMY